MRHEKIMRHIQSVPQRPTHGLNMIALFTHYLRAQGLRLRRISLKTLTGNSCLSLEYSFLGELDHVTEPAVIVGWRILGVPRRRSVRETCGRGGFSAEPRC